MILTLPHEYIISLPLSLLQRDLHPFSQVTMQWIKKENPDLSSIGRHCFWIDANYWEQVPFGMMLWLMVEAIVVVINGVVA